MEEELARKRLDKGGVTERCFQPRLQTDAGANTATDKCFRREEHDEDDYDDATGPNCVRCEKKTLHPQLPARKDGPDRDED